MSTRQNEQELILPSELKTPVPRREKELSKNAGPEMNSQIDECNSQAHPTFNKGVELRCEYCLVTFVRRTFLGRGGELALTCSGSVVNT